MGKTLRCLVLFAALLLCLTGTARAEEYIFQLDAPVSLFSRNQILPEGVEAVREEQGIYVTDDPALLEELEEAGLLVYSEVDTPLELQHLPDDPQYAAGAQWSLDMVGMDYAWRNDIAGAGVRVGVIDSGLNTTHQDLAEAAVLEGKNFCNLNNITTDVTDDVGHGTFVSGIIAAAANNGLDIVGMAPEVELVPLKCFTPSGGSSSKAAAAIYSAVDDYQCDVLNLSFGSSSENATLKAAIDYAEEQGVIVVAAAGNLPTGTVSSGADTLYYPAAWDTVIGVGAVDETGSTASFSRQNDSVFLVAPGENVVSLKSSADSGSRTDSGTSHAAPVVTAAVALMLSINSELTRTEIMDLLASNSRDLGDLGWDAAYGHGVLDLGLLLAALRQDNESLTLYKAEGGVELSAFRTDGTLIVAAWDTQGRMVRVLTADETAWSHLFLEGSDIAEVKLFCLQLPGAVPLGAAVCRTG